MSGKDLRCCYCGNPTQESYEIHRDGPTEGPLMWLCNRCGSDPNITAEVIWEHLRRKRLPSKDRISGAA